MIPVKPFRKSQKNKPIQMVIVKGVNGKQHILRLRNLRVLAKSERSLWVR